MTMATNQVLQTAEIACAILPVGNQQWVVPAVCVAEVLPWRSVGPLADDPAWIAGGLTWHGQDIKVLDFDALVSGSVARDCGRCVVVMNRTSAAGPSFYGLITSGIPRLVQLAQVDIVTEQAADTVVALVSLQVGEEQLTIPDLGQIEGLMAGLGESGPQPTGD